MREKCEGVEHMPEFEGTEHETAAAHKELMKIEMHLPTYKPCPPSTHTGNENGMAPQAKA